MGVLQTGVAVIGLAASVVESTLVTRGSAGCGKSHHIGYNNNGGAGFSLGNRSYTVLVPKDYDPNRAYPLIIDYHGHNGTSDVQYRISQYDKFDTKGKFLAVYPQGVLYPTSKGIPESAWEGPSYADPSVSDLAFTADLVQHIEDNYCIDSKRVYASGKSNGAGFVGTLACSEQGGLFAAFAMSSAALYTDNLGAGAGNRNCTRSRSTIPIMEVHGSADGTVAYDGGKGSGGYLPAIPSWLAAWAGRDQAANQQVNYPSPTFGSRVNTTTWTVPGTTRIVVEGIWIQGMDHCWASVAENADWSVSGRSQAVCQAPLNATIEFLKFFSNWNLDGPIGPKTCNKP